MFQIQILQSFTLSNVAPKNSSFPEGNFGGNQLLDGSISLSPLYSILENGLHVSISTVLHQGFLCIQPDQALFTIFRVPTYMPKRVFFIRRINHSQWGTLSVIRVYNSRTRTYVSFLGPCFKTGRITTPITLISIFFLADPTILNFLETLSYFVLVIF